MRKKALLFYNPYASNGVFVKNLDRIISRFQEKEIVVVPVRASEKNDLEYMLKNIDVSEYRQIISAGGDGTLNICVNAMLKNGIDLPIAVFPSGTANDYAYHLELPQKLDDQIKVALGENMSYSDVGVLNDRYFVNVAAMGNLVDVSQTVDQNLKELIGTRAYYIKGLQEALSLTPIPMHLESEEFTGDVKVYAILITNGESVGGFRETAPGAQINDGMMNVLVIKAMPLIDLARFAADFLQTRHPSNKNLIYFKTKKLRIEAPEDTATDVDGEDAGKFPLEFSVLPRRIRLFTHKSGIA